MEKVQLSQKEFCSLIGISYPTLWKWEKINKMPEGAEIIKLPSGGKRVLVPRDYPGVNDLLDKKNEKV